MSWLVTLGRDEAWAALAVWAVVAAAMAVTLLRRATGRSTSRQEPQAPRSVRQEDF